MVRPPKPERKSAEFLKCSRESRDKKTTEFRKRSENDHASGSPAPPSAQNRPAPSSRRIALSTARNRRAESAATRPAPVAVRATRAQGSAPRLQRPYL